MEEGSSSPHGVAALSGLFDVSSNGFAFRAPRPEEIANRRADMDDKLIFDTLLIAGGVRDPDFLYPPKDVQALQRLLEAIESSSYDTLKKRTLMAEKTRLKFNMPSPPQFAALADAYWHLDAGSNVPKAVSILSDSRLNRDYASKIIRAISLSPQPGPLILKYVRTAKPPLVQPPDMLRYVVALAESSILEAWQYQRTFSEADEMRPRLFKRILDWSISPKVQPSALKSLISLPLSSFEQKLLNEHALKPQEDYDASAIATLQDLVCVRYIELGKYIEAIKMDRKFSASGFDGQESSDRRAMIRELYESLSPVEKQMVEVEIAPNRKEKSQLDSAPAPVLAESSNLSQSWEEVPVPENLNKSTSTPLRNIQIPPTPPSKEPPFTLPTATAPPVAGSRATSPPILQVSSTPSISANGFTPRKSVQRSPHPAQALGIGRPSLSGVGQRLAFNAKATVSSPASGMKFPVGSSKPVSHASSTPTQPVFVSTTNQANAFYQPKPTSQKRPLPEEEEREEAEKEEEEEPVAPEPISGRTEVTETMALDDTPQSPQELEPVPGWKDTEDANELNQSIFGGASRPSAQRPLRETISAPRRASAAKEKVSGKQESRKRQKQPPGAFAADDEVHDSEAEAEAEAERQLKSRKRTTHPRASRAHAQTHAQEAAASPSVKPLRRTKRSVRQIPGGLMDDEDGDGEEEEEGDKLAPLREPSPPPITAKRTVRKARSVASPSEAGSDGEGAPSGRRRSSRLTTSGSLNNLSPEAARGEPAPKARKTARASTSKRKK
ncbi:nuclear pore complex assembly-domain-containing protein [Ephemerocybe angulata]|uniref:Nuclear pore complex assembly-domain-containing protein n=1 Tax=Ephemerocybe angulata TaxID=980116 RepID=A0A8H6MF09_9AGAR|nr:nuclear pore complex assembly-domain-containing protein [Tulosesus angulatus]